MKLMAVMVPVTYDTPSVSRYWSYCRRSRTCNLEAAGVKDVLTKCIGSRNPHNVVRATIDGLRQLTTRDEVLEKRGLSE